jgi:hypothetical protein
VRKHPTLSDGGAENGNYVLVGNVMRASTGAAGRGCAAPLLS